MKIIFFIWVGIFAFFFLLSCGSSNSVNYDEILSNFIDPFYTVFIPTNDVFRDMPQERFEELTDKRNRAALLRFVNRHVVPSEVSLADINNKMANGEEIEVNNGPNMRNLGTVNVGYAQIVRSNINAANGFIHIVDAVVEPEPVVLP